MQSRKLLRVASPIIIGALLLSFAYLATYHRPPAVSGESDETIYYYLTDHLGSVDAVLDEAGNVVERRDYMPYGQERPVNEELGAPKTAQGFTGKELDDETGLNYYGARYYEPVTGRFIQMDPLLLGLDKMTQEQRNAFLSNPQNLNLYSYVTNNPLKYTDPTGLYGEDVHYDLTYYLALKAGLSFDDSYEIALADQDTDDDPATGPWASRETRQTYHFATREQVNSLLDSALDSIDNKEFGQAMHALQDSFSHSGFGPTIGHIMFGSLPDKTITAVKQADFMAKKSFYTLRAYAALKNSPENFDSDAYLAESDRLWEEIEDNVHGFNSSFVYSSKLENLYPELYDEEQNEGEAK